VPRLLPQDRSTAGLGARGYTGLPPHGPWAGRPSTTGVALRLRPPGTASRPAWRRLVPLTTARYTNGAPPRLHAPLAALSTHPALVLQARVLLLVASHGRGGHRGGAHHGLPQVPSRNEQALQCSPLLLLALATMSDTNPLSLLLLLLLLIHLRRHLVNDTAHVQ
jgi:hypothetical protein